MGATVEWGLWVKAHVPGTARQGRASVHGFPGLVCLGCVRVYKPENFKLNELTNRQPVKSRACDPDRGVGQVQGLCWYLRDP